MCLTPPQQMRRDLSLINLIDYTEQELEEMLELEGTNLPKSSVCINILDDTTDDDDVEIIHQAVKVTHHTI